MNDDRRRVRSVLDGIVEDADGTRRYTESDGLYSRVVPLDDIEIVTRAKGGDGRTVRAYAAVFDSPAEIRDQDGHYLEQISRTAFEQSLAMRSRAVGVFYNHGRTLHGTPSERASVPLGRPVMMKADGRGLLTESQYNRTQLADDIIESIRNGDITGQSFTGIFLRSDPKGPYLPARAGDLTLVTRQEIALIEYGPTPIPAYADAEILGVRAAGTDAERAVEKGNIDTPNAADLNTEARAYAAAEGWAMEDGSYPVRPLEMHGRQDLEAAIHAVGRGSHDQIRAHIVKRAHALGLQALIPADWPGAPTPTTSGGSTSSTAAAGNTTSTSGRTEPATGTPAAPSTGAATGRTETTHGAATEPRTHSVTTQNTSREGTMDDRMTVEERAARQSEIRARLQEIEGEYSGATMPEEIQTEWDGLLEENTAHARAIDESERRSAQLRAVLDNPTATERVAATSVGFGGGRGPAVITTRDIYDLTEARSQARSLEDLPGIYRDRAMRAIELAQFPGMESREDAQTRAAYLVETIDDEHGTLARRMLQTGSPVYNRAFGKMITALSQNGLTAEESRALQLGVDANGGFAVPFQLDPTVILTSDGTINPLREVARIEQIVGKEWDGVTSAGVTVTRGAENDEAPDSSPTLAQPKVVTQRVQGFVPFSVEIERSWNAMRSEITMLLQDAKDTEEATSFVLGDGTGTNAGGIIGTLPSNRRVASAATGTLSVPDDIYAVEESLAPRFRARASWLGNKSIYNRIKSVAATMGGLSNDLWARLGAGMPPELAGYAARELSSMKDSIAPSGGGNNLVLLFGDYKRGFLIVDRIGMSIELVPHLFGPNGRPTGQRGIYAYWGNNSKILVPQALRALNVVSPA
ncbi:phage major capsid protein [Streptomyces sp. NPDC088337]|uniref:phage major capsid protein n=1 Tax=unclassified Streptomyces TaxID=2593676 RepID=UPI003817FC40